MKLTLILKHDISKSPRTGDWKFMEPVVDEKKCVGCGTCVSFCPEAVIELAKKNKKETENVVKQKGVAKIDYEFCKGCGVCASVCPIKAINMKKK